MSLSLRTKLLTTGVSFPLILVAVLFSLDYLEKSQQLERVFVNKARSVTLMAEGAREAMTTRWKQGVYTGDMLRAWAAESDKKAAKAKILAVVPVVNAMDTAKEAIAQLDAAANADKNAGGTLRKKNLVTFRAPNPSFRNEANKPDQVDLEVQQYFHNNPGAMDHWRRDYSGNGSAIRYYRRVKLDQNCLYCHGDPKNTDHNIWGNTEGIDITGNKMDGKKAGDDHGMFCITQDVSYEEDALRAQALWGILLSVAVLAVGGVIFALFIVRTVEGPISRISGSLREGSSQVASASDQVSNASQAMAQGASSQAASLEQTSASLEEMSSMTRQNADNARQASAMTREVEKSAVSSQDSLERMTHAITRIKGSADETAKIIKTIDEIAFQTNLLALNAAVEAARAGDAGKGFAVVAEEVRNLAQRSAEAARSTASLINESQINAENGVVVVGDVSKVLRSIIDGVAKVSQLVQEVSAATSEQAKGIDQLNRAVAQMDTVTQSNAANAEESASVSEELNAQARELDAMIGRLELLISGRQAAAEHRAWNTGGSSNALRRLN